MKDDTEQRVMGADSVREAHWQMDKEFAREEGSIWCASAPVES